METLKRDPEGIIPDTGWWSAFNQDPKDHSACEDTAFEPMPQIFHSDLTSGDVSVGFLQNPTRAPTSNARQIATRPDGYMVLKETCQEGNESWDDILLSCEYKQREGVERLNAVSICENSEMMFIVYPCYICVHIRGSRPDLIQDESRLSRIISPDPHPRPSHHADSLALDNPTLISDSGSAVLWTYIDPYPDPPSGLVTFGVRSPFSTPH
jgi:hypothetical protein